MMTDLPSLDHTAEFTEDKSRLVEDRREKRAAVFATWRMGKFSRLISM